MARLRLLQNPERQRSRKPPHAGANPAVGSCCPGGVTEQHRTLLKSRSRFESGPGCCYPRSVADGTRPCEGRGSGSTPDGDTRRWSQMARRPAATRYTVGSIPTGVSERFRAATVRERPPLQGRPLPYGRGSDRRTRSFLKIQPHEAGSLLLHELVAGVVDLVELL